MRPETNLIINIKYDNCRFSEVPLSHYDFDYDFVFLPETNFARGPCGIIAPLNRAVDFPFWLTGDALIGPILGAGTGDLV